MNEYIHYGHTDFDKAIFNTIKNGMNFTKPFGGFWGSPVNAKHGWKDWCTLSNFRKCEIQNSFKFTLDDAARVLTITACEQLVDLPKLNLSKFIPEFVISLDFEQLALQYDAIEVSISTDPHLLSALMLWDCDSILVFNPDVVLPR